MDVLLPALVCAVLGGLSGWFVPHLIAVVPEPEPDPEPGPDEEPREPAAPKELYVDVARIPDLAWRSVAVTTVVGGLFGASLGWVWPLVYLVPFVPVGVALAVIDWRTRRLPTWYLAPMYPAMILLVLLCGVLTRDWDDLRRAGFGWLAMGGFYFLTNLVSGRLVGYGDVRLSGLLGIALGYLGWGQLVVGMYLAFLIFGLPPFFLALVRRDVSILKMKMPFGPAMLASAATGVVLGATIGHWYLRLSGIEG